MHRKQLVIESVTGAVTQQDRDPASHFQLGPMLQFNREFSIQFQFFNSSSAQCCISAKNFNFSSSPMLHFNPRIFNFNSSSAQCCISTENFQFSQLNAHPPIIFKPTMAQFMSGYMLHFENRIYSQQCTGCISALNFQSYATFSLSFRSARNGHFNSVLRLNAGFKYKFSISDLNIH